MPKNYIMQGNRREQIPLVRFCQLGDCENVQKLLKQGVSPNSVGSFGWIALQEAANEGHSAVVSLLCLQGDCRSDLNYLGSAGETALHKCTVNDDAKTMEVLLSLGSEVDVRNTGGHSALHVATYHDNFEAVRLLLSDNADVILCDRWNQTPLLRAAARGCISVVQLLLDHRSDVFLTHDQGFTPLHLAVAWGSVPTVGLLLAAGSDINALNRNRKTAADVGQSAEASLAIRDVSSQAPKLQ